MAAAFVQSVTFSGENVNSFGVTLNGVAAGNFLACMPSTYTSGGPTNTAPTDDKGNTWNTTTAPTVTVSSSAFIFYAMNVAAGNTAVTWDPGNGMYGTGSVAEFSGVATSAALDQQASNNNNSSATPTSGTTGTTTQADELVLACVMTGCNVADDGIDLPSGYSNIYTYQNSAQIIGHSSDYRIVSATGTQSASWGTIVVSAPWNAKIATFKAAGGAAATSLPIRRAFPRSVLMH